ncbi:hypothetical protein ACNHKD_08925 [Methylocystis sp. JAN1]|uniref:hypothetical protein n=1 Tax=Methylocystis sp. JAN1 TaxID=3397211 RepID=UPI003FA28619
MGKKPKAGGAPRKPKEPKLEDKEQSERFIQTARELGADEDQCAFEAAFEKIIVKKNSNDQDRQG